MSNQDTKIEKIEEVLNQTTNQKVQFIANIANQVLSSPYKCLPKVQNLLHLLDSKDLFIAKVVSLSLTQIFKDIAPLYKIQKEEIELKLKKVIRKDERKILNYEYMLLTYYEKFLKKMYSIKQYLQLNSKENLRQFETVMLTSMTELYKNLFYFNFNVDILNTISKYMLSRNPQIQNIIMNFVEYIFQEENFNLQKFGSLLKNRKLEKLISYRLWEALVRLKFEYQEEIKDKTEKVNKQKKYIDKLQNLKEKGKLSKRRQRELKEKSQILEKMDYKLQKEKEKKALLKQVQRDLKKTDVDIDIKKYQKIAKQILLKILFIIFKVLEVYPESKGLMHILRCLNRNFLRMDKKFQFDVLEKLKTTFDYYNTQKDQKKMYVLNKKLFLLDCIIKISKEKNTEIQVEQFYSLKCFYNIICQLLLDSTLLIDNENNTQITLLYLFENLLLNQQIFSKEVKENFLIAILILAFKIKQCKNLKISLIFFTYQFLTKYTRLYLTALDQDQNIIPQDQLKKDKLLDYLNPFIESPQNFPFVQILDNLKKQLFKVKDVKVFINAILEKKPVQTKFFGKRVSSYYKELSKQN